MSEGSPSLSVSKKKSSESNRRWVRGDRVGDNDCDGERRVDMRVGMVVDARFTPFFAGIVVVFAGSVVGAAFLPRLLVSMGFGTAVFGFAV